MHACIDFLLRYAALKGLAVQLFAFYRSVLLESGGELPRGLPCVISGTAVVDDRGLLTRTYSVFDFHQSAAPCSLVLHKGVKNTAGVRA